jgi:LysM repeat protein
MQRNIKGEVLAAIAAVTLLVFTVVFGVLLSTPDEEIVGDGIASPEAVTEPADETQTPAPTDTSILAATAIVQVATETEESTLTATLTEVTPTTTITNTSTAEPTISPTRITPTSTQTATPSPIPTTTPTQTATFTPTSTSTATATFTHTATHTPTPTRTLTASPVVELGILSTPTEDPAVMVISTPAQGAVVSQSCGAPAGWPVYVVQPGNTLFSIARAVGSTVTELRDANCLLDVNIISTGDELAVPRLPVGPVLTGVPSVVRENGTPAFTSLGCISSAARIAAPGVGQRVSGRVNVIGTASLDNLEYLKLEIRADNATTYNFYSRQDTQVINGLLGTIDTSLFGRGVFHIRLAVVDNTGNVPRGATCVIPVIFE